jgi:hypothetical protein
MPRCRCVSHHFPDRSLYQIGRPPPSETALDLFDAGDFSPRPGFLQSGGNVGKGGKALSSGMQVDQIVVPLDRECLLCSNPEDASLDVCEPSCGLRFGKVAITSFIIFHASLGDEELS